MPSLCGNMLALAKAPRIFFAVNEASHEALNIGQNACFVILTNPKLVDVSLEICLLYSVANG